MTDPRECCARLESEAQIVGDKLVISLSANTLAHAARHSGYFERCAEDGTPLKITNESAFAKSVANALPGLPVTLRDHFAMHASEDEVRHYGGMLYDGTAPRPDEWRVTARYAYADAMLAVRGAPTPPAPGMAVTCLVHEIIDALLADEKDGGYDLTAGLFGPNFSNLVRRWAALEYAAVQRGEVRS
jgi:hypothetical protein